MKKKALTHKERQDIMWALAGFADKLREHDSVAASESADRLRLLRERFESGER
jgi:hypothetical protein